MIKIVNASDCDGCEVCVDSCPTQVLGIIDGIVAIIDSELCTECRVCMHVCPYGVLEVVTE